MKRLLIAFLFLSYNTFAGDIVITSDTTVNSTWNIPANTIIRFETGGHITGSGTINGGIYQAAFTQNILDTNLTIAPSKMYNINFSGRWFGANPSNTGRQNRIAIQKAINLCVAYRFPLFIPSGAYTFDSSLTVAVWVGGISQPCYIKMFGEANYWDEASGNGTYFNFTNRSGYGLGLQYNKNSDISGFVISGQFTAPTFSADTITKVQYADWRDYTCGQLYFGISIDPLPNSDNSTSGSSAIFLHNLVIRKFAVGIINSLNVNGMGRNTLNAESLRYEDIYFGDMKACIISTQGQEKNNLIRNVIAWGNHYCFFRAGLDGISPAAGNWTIDGFNLVGGIQEFMIRSDTWGQVNIMNGFTESSISIGSIISTQNLRISNCTFDVRANTEVGVRPIMTTNTLLNSQGLPSVIFDNCLFRLFGTGGTLQFVGLAGFMNCYWYGTYYNTNPNGRVQLSLPSGLRIGL